ncbi:MAG TPA: hypothetical protein DEQ61_04890, partial [Streptomyces sp.]|nr:hypothetical protein [Streptomyces sp.]
MPKPGPLLQTSQTAATSDTPRIGGTPGCPGREPQDYLRRPARRTPPGHYPSGVPPILDATLLTGWARAAVRALERHRTEIDRINVFPVPDGDTGTNLLMTMRSAAEQIGPPATGTTSPESRVASALARGALLGARGNSGVILSQVLRG